MASKKIKITCDIKSFVPIDHLVKFQGDLKTIEPEAMEIAPEYVDVAVNRWQNFTGKDAILESSGNTFEDVKKRRN